MSAVVRGLRDLRGLRDHAAAYKDAIVTFVVIGCAVAGLLLDPGGGNDSTVVAPTVALAAAGAVWFRRRFPVGVLLLVVSAHVFLIANVGNEVALVGAVAVALYSITRHSDRGFGLRVAGIVGAATAAASAGLDTDQFFAEFAGELALMAAPIAVADAARSRAEQLRNIIEAEAASRVQAERLRIARDLHDVVAHGLSTIAVQSGVAAHLIDRDVDQARTALEVINATGKNSLEELRTMVGVLRSTDGAPLRPTPTDPNDVSDLVNGAASAGVIVDVAVTGAFPGDVSDSCAVALHRIIQEALTNVARHAGAVPATIRIDHHGERVDIRIENSTVAGRAAGPGSTGVGIIGMRERAESLGGTLTAGPKSTGGFEVAATLPYQLTGEDR